MTGADSSGNADSWAKPDARLTDARRLDWLRLIRSESVGPRTFRSLVNRFGGAGAALEALPGLAAQRGRVLRIATREECEREIEAMARLGARFLALGEPDYPETLRAIDAPPPLIAAHGDMSALRRPMVAIVGSRNASAAGLAFTERMARDLAAAGYVVVSGLARGVDARAHRSSLGSGTIAVLAGGLDKIYPSEHITLARDMLEHGALVTEMPIGWEPRGRDFPRRNRLISGLALGIVVVEAARKSGSLITARFAMEQGREVFAVPGSPLDPRSEGTNGLLRQGATICTRGEDVIEALAPLLANGLTARTMFGEEARPGDAESFWDEFDPATSIVAPHAESDVEMTAPEASAPDRVSMILRHDRGDTRARIEQLLGPAPVAIDDLVRAASMPVADVRVALLELELDGRIERHGGNLVSLVMTEP